MSPETLLYTEESILSSSSLASYVYSYTNLEDQEAGLEGVRVVDVRLVVSLYVVLE